MTPLPNLTERAARITAIYQPVDSAAIHADARRLRAETLRGIGISIGALIARLFARRIPAGKRPA